MRIEKSIVIKRPTETVFAFVTDMCNVPRWTPAKEIRSIREGSLCIGAQFVQVVEMLGQQFEIITEITAYEPCTTFAFKAISGPLPFENRFTFAPIEEGTCVSAVGEGEPGSVLKLAGPFVTALVKRQVDTQMSMLKSILET